MKFITLAVCFLAILAGVFAQDYYRQLYAEIGSYPQRSSGLRDPRSNRGPVVFPAGPPSPSDETSGVIVGASGYGFVPPGNQKY
ncbi:uncharacterized protein Wat [Neodiprion pinetum]|uniref:Uncharacterized protein LOC107218383 n=1 Tax=Neodiprion lecontei TaxID=441921 RepID=A0A6J0BDD9_NEOLC|nr:uncharacterized protein LOC107218383 [Neodiprion lecontei]XP_046420851.1 uncharacterized protein LOC124179975 [Neodiprion fabricii]XP_046477216.1 uncharacterized protein LOC124216596 [Neodiprion pinetum]XP_046614770.1 uncharacterized protein LOC124302543 [Neodiprion virginianus]